MLATAAPRLSQSGLLATIYQRLVSSLDGTLHTHGVTRFTKSGARLIHDSTELTFQPKPGESPEGFTARVCAEADDGDVIEFRVRDGKLTAAQITRQSAQPLRILPGESFEAFTLRVKHYMDAPRA